MSPIFECSFDSESTKHFFLYCPRYAAERDVLLTSAANILSKHGHQVAMRVNLIFHCTVSSLNYDLNCAFFHEVHSFIINTNRFSEAIV